MLDMIYSEESMLPNKRDIHNVIVIERTIPSKLWMSQYLVKEDYIQKEIYSCTSSKLASNPLPSYVSIRKVCNIQKLKIMRYSTY